VTAAAVAEPAAVRVFGVRHHGPGSARSLVAGLRELRPDVVLVEGPPDADALIPLAAGSEMVPPVALLVYAAENTRRAAFYPFAVFSPEWQALRYALAAGVPARFIDLPAAVHLSGEGEDPAAAIDPIGMLSEAAGDPDPERWWERMVEQRGVGEGLFEAIGEAMAAMREAAPEPSGLEACREAHMRQAIRAARRERFQRIAVVCGAWHAPALEPIGPAAADVRLLQGLPRVRVAATWVPWTSSRLALGSGYGAGVESPGWYRHLWEAPGGEGVGRWLTLAARLLRDEDLDASAAQVIDAVRLAHALAAMRERVAPSLDEVTEAIRSVLCAGAEEPMRLIWRRLVVGVDLGRIPPDAPAVPLQRDLEREQRRLRLRAEAEERTLDLDLRAPRQLEVSRLLHRLLLLQVGWGRLGAVTGRVRGTFHEVWRLTWRPELALAVIEASVWGRTVAEAARDRAIDRAASTEDLGPLAALLDAVLLSDLPEAVDAVMAAFRDRSALTTDVQQLMDALPALARTLRYGSVRQAEAGVVGAVLEGLVARVCVALPSAAGSLDDDAAEALARRIGQADHAIGLVGSDELTERWLAALERVLRVRELHGLVGGRTCRLLLERRRLPAGEAARRLGLALSRVDPAHGAAWLEGFLVGSGLVLLTDDDLFRLLDEWLCGLRDADFEAMLPLVRRTFSTFAAAERRQIGERVRHERGAAVAADGLDLDPARAALVDPVLDRLLERRSSSRREIRRPGAPGRGPAPRTGASPLVVGERGPQKPGRIFVNHPHSEPGISDRHP
jgi:Family of unknown function (DUF5682)